MMVLNVLWRLHAEAKSHVLQVMQGVRAFSFGMQKQEVFVYEDIFATFIYAGKVDWDVTRF